MQNYEILSTVDNVLGDGGDISEVPNLNLEQGGDDSLDRIVAVRNDKPFPISKPPPKARDWFYAVMFLLHFGGVLLLSLIEHGSLRHSVLTYERASSWASMLMIITLLGSSVGALLVFLLNAQNIRETMLAACIPFSLVLKVCLGNILLIMRSEYSFLGVLVLISAVIDSFWNRSARESVSFSSALLGMASDSIKLYRSSLVVVCAVLIAAQTCILLWWGAFFVGLISTVSAGYAETLIVIMAFSLYWITQFFHSLLAFIVGGCVLWIFVRDEHQSQQQHLHDVSGIILPSKINSNEEKRSFTEKLLLYVRCGLTTSLGSVCRGALLTAPAECVLALQHWATRRPQQAAAVASQPFYCSLCSARGVAHCLLGACGGAALPFAERHHRLSFCLLALYGRAFCPTALAHRYAHPETLDICTEDCTRFLLDSVGVVAAGLLAIAFGFVAERGEGASWPLFFFVCFYLAYCGISLAMQIYSGAVDALIVASAINPIRFAHENQIVFLRFLRTSEPELR